MFCQDDPHRNLGVELLKKTKMLLLYSQDTSFSNSDYVFKDLKQHQCLLLTICDVLTVIILK